jgi:hypothetical protein
VHVDDSDCSAVLDFETVSITVCTGNNSGSYSTGNIETQRKEKSDRGNEKIKRGKPTVSKAPSLEGEDVDLFLKTKTGNGEVVIQVCYTNRGGEEQMTPRG